MKSANAGLWTRRRLRGAVGGVVGVVALLALDLAVPSPVVEGSNALTIELTARAAGLTTGSAWVWLTVVLAGVALGVMYGEGFRAFTGTGALRAGAIWGLSMAVLVAPFLLPYGVQIVTLRSLPAAFGVVTRWFVLFVVYGAVLAWVEDRKQPAPARERR
jgi:hypothetical protein